MYPGRFFMPNVPYTMPMKNPGFFSRLLGNFRGINWSSLLTSANKTLNVVNQTIPLIRQTGPMINNLRSMMHLARAFNSETGQTKRPVAPQNSSEKRSGQSEIQTDQPKEANYSESPNFFI